MEIREILSKCDHTLLAPQATFEEIRQVCDEGIRARHRLGLDSRPVL